MAYPTIPLLSSLPDDLDERMKEAVQEIVDQLVALHAGELTALYVYGSVARGDAGEFSDINLMGIVRDDLPKRAIRLIKADAALDDYMKPEGRLETVCESEPYVPSPAKDRILRERLLLWKL